MWRLRDFYVATCVFEAALRITAGLSLHEKLGIRRPCSGGLPFVQWFSVISGINQPLETVGIARAAIKFIVHTYGCSQG